MPVSDYQSQLVRESFAAIAPKGAAFAATFFQRLYHDFPETQPEIPTDPHLRQKEMLGAVVLLVQHLETPELLPVAIEQLGVSPDVYELVAEHRVAVGRTLQKTLAEFAGDVWGSELQQAWSDAFQAAGQQFTLSYQESFALPR